ncbi:hypothetical protein [Maribacter sp. ACAM166]|uniref:hypothetical protein n=1 Tax=Maribacter sp. ACAM166 TaxID=2508996 RepID=UPI0010FD6680|nr:hypothetical protein [Maribacter sp. ACAM166]TLP81350.1 hypothetical protein ES765_04910 [Maribacter sp. ACAM166]
MAKDILLNDTGELTIANGDFVIGDSEDQEVQLILEMAQGELKEDPLLGADLFRLIHSNATDAELKLAVKLQLARDGKDYDKLKERIKIQVNE